MSTAPRTIMVIRHAEKPDETPDAPPPHGIDEMGQVNVSCLIPRGWQRAGALAVLLGDGRVAEPFVRPTALIAPDYGSETPDHRTTQTLTPLSRRLQLPIKTPVPKGKEADVVQEVLRAAGEDVLLCWEHHHIPDIMSGLASALDIADLPPLASSWPDDDFDSVLVLTNTNGQFIAAKGSQNALG